MSGSFNTYSCLVCLNLLLIVALHQPCSDHKVKIYAESSFLTKLFATKAQRLLNGNKRWTWFSFFYPLDNICFEFLSSKLVSWLTFARPFFLPQKANRFPIYQKARWKKFQHFHWPGFSFEKCSHIWQWLVINIKGNWPINFFNKKCCKLILTQNM